MNLEGARILFTYDDGTQVPGSIIRHTHKFVHVELDNGQRFATMNDDPSIEITEYDEDE